MVFDLIGIGLGPFNLSLAALLEKVPMLNNLFLDKKPKFSWHPELIFPDAFMQTSFLNDLVTPLDPTSPYSFLNYLAQKNLFYPFLNTERNFISRMEFEQYCQWVTEQIPSRLRFNSDVHSITFNKNIFTLETPHKRYLAKNICVATGLTPRIPTCAQNLLGPNVFYARSPHLARMKLTGKTVTIIGGGQTGVEIFSNIVQGTWGQAKSIRLVTSRHNLQAYDVSPFTNEYFTPQYMNSFWPLDASLKSKLVAQQYLLSDGSTPDYLFKLYNELYQKKYVEHDNREMAILACRKLIGLRRSGQKYALTIYNELHACKEYFESDVVILCTGFESKIPSFLKSLSSEIHFDEKGRFNFNKDYSIQWNGSCDNKIYALNFSRHQHGIIDPQTNLMAWRAGVVINDLAKHNVYKTEMNNHNFVEFDLYRPAKNELLNTVAI